MQLVKTASCHFLSVIVDNASTNSHMNAHTLRSVLTSN